MTQVFQIANIFPENLLNDVHNVIKTVPWRYGWASNRSIEFTHWNHDFANAGADNGLDRADRLTGPIKTAWEYLQQNYLGPQALLRCYTNSHTYGVEGYPHTDSKRSADHTIVVYMTPDWQRNWGGETMIYEGDKIVHAELPHFNNAIIFPGAAWHCARAVTRICPAQRITLMFKFAAHNTDPQRERIQLLLESLGADKIKHKYGKLINHLLRVYDMLKQNGHNDITAGAGGLHSVFGTNVFQHQCLGAEQRNLVVNAIGPEATELVELFRDVNRPAALVHAVKNNTLDLALRTGSTRSVTKNQLNSLCAIEAANLADQKVLKKYPDLEMFLRNLNEKQTN